MQSATRSRAELLSRSGLLMMSAALATPTACLAGPQVMLYVTIPVDMHNISARTFGLRLDRASAPPSVLITNPASPLNRRPLLDLQLGSDAGLRLEIDRRVAWDFGRQQLVQSEKPARIALRLPVPQPAKATQSP